MIHYCLCPNFFETDVKSTLKPKVGKKYALCMLFVTNQEGLSLNCQMTCSWHSFTVTQFHWFANFTLIGCYEKLQSKVKLPCKYIHKFVKEISKYPNFLWFLKCMITRVSVQGVKSLGGHFALFMLGVWILWSKRKYLLLFFKKKMEILLHF